MQGTIQQSITAEDEAVCEEPGCNEDATTFNADELVFQCDEHNSEVAV